MTKVFNKKNIAKLMAAMIISGSIVSAGSIMNVSADEIDNVTTVETTSDLSRASVKNGFVNENGKTYYYKDGKKIKGWLKIGDKTYYLLNDYSLAKSMWRKIDGKTYYFDKNAVMLHSGFYKIGDRYYRFYSNGSVSSAEVGIVGKCDYLNVRSSASSKASVVDKINTGDYVEVKDYKNGWYKVITEEWKTGWVSADYISIPGNEVAKVIDVAMDQIGKPYKWGATGPNSFDCSGLMYYSFKEGANKTIPRTSSQQANYGKKVSKSELKAGDMVFFGSGGRVTHVGLYIGNDQYVHSPQTGDVVKISKLSNRTMMTARRVFN